MKHIVIPEIIQRLLAAGAAAYIGTSGGKDSDALMRALGPQLKALGVPVEALSCDLGEHAEWPEALPHIEAVAGEVSIPLSILRRPQGGLVEQIRGRMERNAGDGRPMWPSSQQRYCTAGQKDQQINKVLRAHQLVINIVGIRAEESDERRMRLEAGGFVTVRKAISADKLFDHTPEGKKKVLDPELAFARWQQLRQFEQLDLFGASEDNAGRLCLNWFPLHDWTIEGVWAASGTSQAELDRRRALWDAGERDEALAGWPCSPVYVYGASRHSCMFCVLGRKSDHLVAARLYPDSHAVYAQLERDHGFSFKKGYQLATIV